MTVGSVGSSAAAHWCRTLGGLALYRTPSDPRPLMEAGKPLAALVYVALTPAHRVERDHVAELLWPGHDLSEARHSLRQSLYRLRQATGGVALVSAHGNDLLLTSDLSLDCLDGERLGADGEPARACELLRGNFLDGFSVPESREFESWAEGQRTRFREAWANAAQRVVAQCLATGDVARALETAEDLAARFPLSDEPMLLVMTALAGAGRHAAAVARYHAHADLVRRELDEQPGADLDAYRQELEAYLKSLPGPSAQQLPFVGRSEQWSALETAWAGAQVGHGAAVLIEGAAGLGKSRLIAELVGRTRASGGVVLLGKCYDIERAVPYAAIADALVPIVERPEVGGLSPAWLTEAARLLPELRERFTGLPPAGDTAGSPAAKRRLHQAVARLLEIVAEEAPVLLIIDDVHWADGPSLEILHFLSHRLREAKVLSIASYRPAELSPVARQFARSLCAAKLADLIVLDPLEASDIGELLGKLARFEDSGAADAVAEHLQRHTAGNPLFLNELLGALARDRVLFVRDGRWQVRGPSTGVQLPQTLGKLMADRIDRLAPGMRTCLETMAVATAETQIEVLAQALQVSEPRATLALAVLEEERLIKRTGVDTFELAHDELRAFVYHGIPDERRRLLHAAVGSALESRGEAARPGGAARLAFHFDHAGMREPAHSYALAAAGEAEALAAPGEQRAHMEMAEAHAPKALPPVRRVEVRGWLGFLRRHGLVAGAAAGLALVSAGAGYLYAPVLGGAPPYRQETLYLGSASNTSPSHRIHWPARRGELARIEQLRAAPAAFPTSLVHLNVTDSNETHAKLFAVRRDDSVQLTFGLSDDAGAQWAPDGRQFLFTRGWRTNPARYQQNVFLADSSGRILRPLTDSPWQDSYAVWSPSGAQLAFARDSAGEWSIWVSDADGANPRNVTEELGLPRVQGVPSFAPDDQRVSVVYPDTGSGHGAIYLVDLVERAVRPIGGTQPGLLGARGLWSPDGRWLAYLTGRNERHGLWVVSTDEPAVPVLIAEVSSELSLLAWGSGERRYAATVEIEPGPIAVGTARGVRAVGHVRAPEGETVPSYVRWSVGDTSIARVDHLGFVQGRTPGITSLVASAGGFRADTVPLRVTAAPMDTLLVEDWSAGLDTTRWTPFGYPRPVVIEGVEPDGRAAFLNNGDYNHGSGVVSVARFEVGNDGFTVEADAWFRFTGHHWQIWSLSFDTDPFSGGRTEVSDGMVGFSIAGNSPMRSAPSLGCQGPGRSAPDLAVPGWRRFVVQVRPDGQALCFVDGRLIGRGPMPSHYRERPLAIVLRGHSVGTEIYHGRVVVMRGVFY